MTENTKQTTENASSTKGWCCNGEGSCRRYGGKRCWFWILGLLVLLFAAYHLGWYSAMNYFGATWDTPRGVLSGS